MKRLGWPRERRLLKRAQFQACYGQGSKYFSKSFILFVLRREDDLPGIRVGLTVSRKVGNAVVRNRVKRVLREFFRLHQHQFDCPADIVVAPKRVLDPMQLNLDQATGELVRAMQKVHKDMMQGIAPE